MSTLPKVPYFKGITLDTTRIIREIDANEYTTKLLNYGFCVDRLLQKRKSPFVSFREFIENNDTAPCVILGCTGVGKSSFVEFNKNNSLNHHVVLRYDLDSRSDENLSAIDIHRFLLNQLLDIVKNRFKIVDQLEIIKVAINSVPRIFDTIIYDSNLSYSEDELNAIKSNIQKHLENIYSRDTVDDYEFLNKSLLSSISKKVSNDFRVILVIDNLDRRDNYPYEDRIIQNGILDIWESYSKFSSFKMAISLRRVTFRLLVILSGFGIFVTKSTQNDERC